MQTIEDNPGMFMIKCNHSYAWVFFHILSERLFPIDMFGKMKEWNR